MELQLNFKLEKVNDISSLNAIKRSWLKEVKDEDSDFLDYLESRIFRMCESVIERNDPADVWVLQSGEDGTPRALVELSDASKAKIPSIKFLTLHIEPKYLIRKDEDLDRSRVIEVIKIITAAMFESFSVAQNNHECQLKVLGGNELLKELFPALILGNDPEKTGIEMRRQSNWLLINKA